MIRYLDFEPLFIVLAKSFSRLSHTRGVIMARLPYCSQRARLRLILIWFDLIISVSLMTCLPPISTCDMLKFEEVAQTETSQVILSVLWVDENPSDWYLDTKWLFTKCNLHMNKRGSGQVWDEDHQLSMWILSQSSFLSRSVTWYDLWFAL